MGSSATNARSKNSSHGHPDPHDNGRTSLGPPRLQHYFRHRAAGDRGTSSHRPILVLEGMEWGDYSSGGVYVQLDITIGPQAHVA